MFACITAILHHLLTDYKGMNDEPFFASKSDKFCAISHWLVTVEVGTGGDFCAKSSRNMFFEFFVLFFGKILIPVLEKHCNLPRISFKLCISLKAFLVMVQCKVIQA